jgi:hypothetical protein
MSQKKIIILIFIASVLTMAGILLDVAKISGGDFLKGFGGGISIVICVFFVNKYIKSKRNETTTE